MKLKRLAPLALAAPLALLTACGSSAASLNFTANWYSDSGNTNITDTLEELEYTVTLEKSATESSFRVEYDEGATYKTTLTNTSTRYKGDDSTSYQCYYYRTEFSATGRYVDGSKTQEFTESVVSEAWFLPVEKDLAPVRSVKTVHSFVPDPQNNREVTEFNYVFTVEYNPELTEAEVVFDDKMPANKDDTATVKLRGDGTYLDNEQMLFALRGLNLSGGVSFRSINTVKQSDAWSCVSVSTQSTPVTDVYAETFDIGGVARPEGDIAVTRIELGYASNYTGGRKTYTYANYDTANNYRNVLLKMEEPLLYNLGTLVFQLKSAKFAK